MRGGRSIAAVSPPRVTRETNDDLEPLIRDLEMEPYDHLDGIETRAEQLLAIAERHENVSLALRCRLVAADVASRSHDVPRAALIANSVLQTSQELGDVIVESRCQSLIAVALWRIGERAGSIERAMLATDLISNQTPYHLRIDALMIRALVACGFAAGPERLALFDEPVELCQSVSVPILEVATMNNLAWYQLQNGLVDESRLTVATIERIIASTGSAANLAVVDTIARVLRATGEIERAERLLSSAIAGPDAASITEPATIPGTLVTRAAFARDRGALDLAQRDLERALDICEDAGFIEIGVEALRELSSLAAERGDFRVAYGHLLACHTKWEQLKQVEAEVKAATLQVLHGTERALERVRAYEEMARTDPLTGLWNRRFLENELPPILERSARRQHAVVLAIADIDYFKRVNDELSHDVGDTVLQTFARLIRTVVGDAGTVVRLGGEEFLLVLDRCNSLQAERIIRQVCTTVREHDWIGAGLWPLTISIGVVESRNDRTIPELLALADQNLYRAKRAGRDQVVGAEA